jgi:hypothetical protein
MVFPEISNLVAATAAWNQGDMLILDQTNHLVRLAANEGELVSFIGISQISIANGKPLSPYTGTAVDAAQAVPAIPGPVFGVVAEFVLNTGDSLNPGDYVYGKPSVGPQVVSASGTQIIGIYQGKAVASAAAGTKVLVGIKCNKPSSL